MPYKRAAKIPLTFAGFVDYIILSSLKKMVEWVVEENSFPQQFERLESRIERLVDTCEKLQSAKVALEKKIEDLKTTLIAKDETEQNYRQEKTIIRSKVDDLLGRLDRVLEST